MKVESLVDHTMDLLALPLALCAAALKTPHGVRAAYRVSARRQAARVHHQLQRFGRVLSLRCASRTSSNSRNRLRPRATVVLTATALSWFLDGASAGWRVSSRHQVPADQFQGIESERGPSSRVEGRSRFPGET